MSASSSPPLKRSPLHDRHEALGARMVPFAGWTMPLNYSGITSEHLAVREAAGMFDVSHMGEVEVAGADALTVLQRVVSNDVGRLAVGQALYTPMTTPEGTFVDDVIVYRLAEDHYLAILNAANTAKDVAWVSARALEHGGDVAVVNSSARYALLAVHGPQAAAILQSLTDIDLSTVRSFWCAHGEVAGVRSTVARTGYTGEDGFEILCPPQQASRVWDAVLDTGRPMGLEPCGLGARDTLRLEACLRLYGNDIDETVTVLEAGLGWTVAWDKGDFIGRTRLDEQRVAGPARRLVAFEMVDRAIARPGCAIVVDGEARGVVTSGTQTPFLKRAVGLAMVPRAASEPGTLVQVDIRGRLAQARVVREPLYSRRRGPSATPATT